MGRYWGSRSAVDGILLGRNRGFARALHRLLLGGECPFSGTLLSFRSVRDHLLRAYVGCCWPAIGPVKREVRALPVGWRVGFHGRLMLAYEWVFMGI